MLNLYILNYNNYYNRIVKRESSLADYLSTKYYNNVVINNVNFYMNDGVNTSQVLNSFVSGDYAVLTDDSSGVEQIASRWFIINCKRNCKGQFDLMLRRDLVVDNFDIILNADTFIEKAILQDSDPLIFNNENMTVNEIKQSALPIKDKTSFGYIVGYVDKNFSQDESVLIADEENYYATKAQFESDWGTMSNVINKNTLIADYIIYGAEWLIDTVVGQSYINVLEGTYREDTSSTLRNALQFFIANESKYNGNALAQLIKNNANATTLKNALVQDYNGGIDGKTIKDINTISAYNGKIIKDTDNNKYYKVNLSTATSQTIVYNVPASGNMYTALSNLVATKSSGYPSIQGTANNKSFVVNMSADVYTYTLSEVQITGYKYTIQASHTKLSNQLFDMFVIPFQQDETITNRTIRLPNSTTEIIPNKDAAIKVANDIILKQSSGGVLKDIQILPYFPLVDIVKEITGLTNKVTIEIPSDKYTSIIYDNETNAAVNMLIWCDKNQFESTLGGTIFDTIIASLDINSNVKIDNECTKVRIVSPNHQSMFEFSPAKNGYKSNQAMLFDVKCTYKPYQPSIQVKPQFARLYGNNSIKYDARGLIFSGDYSMTQASDSWTQYKRQNVNYLNIFDRQIQNMEVQNKYQNQMAQISSISSALTTGVGAGLATGNLVAGLGAGATSLIAGQLDLQIQKDLQSEALDYKQDLFNYQLGNIKALPDTISKVDAYNNVFSIWPQLEWYTCTDEEKKAVAYKIAYNSMSVGKIGKIKDYIQNTWSYGDITSKGYIKGKVIRLEGINEDTHYINELANEINKGVYYGDDSISS